MTEVDKMKEEFIISPNLPQGRASLVLMSGRRPAAAEELSRLGIRRTDPGRLEGISGAEGYHADMSFCHIGGNRLFFASNGDPSAVSRLSSEGFSLTTADSPVTAKRPSLNVCIIGNKVLCDTRTADEELLRLLSGEGHKVLHTNQRYTRCSSAVLGNNAIITSDPSVYALCKENGIDVLKICPGYIELDGYEYGFIGGCCGLLSPDTLAFSGRIGLHPDYENIRSFAGEYGIELLSLSDEPLYDVGGIIALKAFGTDDFV